MRSFNFKKAVQLLNFFAIKSGGTINKMKAIKLVWLSDRLHLRRFGRTITGDTYFALPNGPVPSGTRDILEASVFIDDMANDYASEYISSLDKYNFQSLLEINELVFSKSDLLVASEIYDFFKNKDHFELSSFSHVFPEWVRFKSPLEKKLSSRFNINIEDFFVDVEESSGLFKECEDIKDLVKDIYIQNNFVSNLSL